MGFSILSLASTATVLLLGTPTLAQFPKPVLFTDGLSPHVDQSFWANLAPVEYVNIHLVTKEYTG